MNKPAYIRKDRAIWYLHASGGYVCLYTCQTAFDAALMLRRLEAYTGPDWRDCLPEYSLHKMISRAR
jgi:hypothetical protein